VITNAANEIITNAANETTRPIGVYLCREDKARLQAVANHEGLKRHALLQFAVLRFLREYEEGRIQLPTQTTRSITKPFRK
jgi:hypothetical protein